MHSHQHLSTSSSDCSGSYSGVFVTFHFESLLNLLPKHLHWRSRSLECEIYCTAARRERNLVGLWWSVCCYFCHCFVLRSLSILCWSWWRSGALRRSWVLDFFLRADYFRHFSKICEILTVYLFLHLSMCLSACNSVFTGFIFVKFYIFEPFFFFLDSVEKFQVSLKSDKNNEHLTWRPIYIYDNISVNYSKNKKCIMQNCRQNKAVIVCLIALLRKRAFYEIMRRNIAEQGRSQITI